MWWWEHAGLDQAGSREAAAAAEAGKYLMEE